MQSLRIKLLSSDATVPKRGSAEAAGYDLSAAHNELIPPGERRPIKTNVAVGIPLDHYGKIAPRSGLALRNGIDVLAGVIDRDYTGDVTVILLNTDKTPFEVKKGDRIAQLILHKISTPDVLVVDELSQTERGSGGFGSTGMTNLPNKELEGTTGYSYFI